MDGRSATRTKPITAFYGAAKRPHSPSKASICDKIPNENRSPLTKIRKCDPQEISFVPPAAVTAAMRVLESERPPKEIVGRQPELNGLRGFITNSIKNKTAGSFYVFGGKGTGKTTCVQCVLNEFKDNKNCHVIYAKCDQTPNELCKQIFESLKGRSGVVKGKQTGSITNRLKDIFVSSKNMIVLCLDDFDKLSQKAIIDVLDWTLLPKSKVIITAVGNAPNATSKFLAKIKLKAVSTPKMVQFSSYSSNEIVDILKAYLSEHLNVFHPQAIELCGRKCASSGGDFRHALQICLTSLNRAVERWETVKSGCLESVLSPVSFCLPIDVAGAMSEAFGRNCDETYTMLPLQQKLFFASAYSLASACYTQFDLDTLFREYETLCAKCHVPAVCSSRKRYLCDMLECQGLIKKASNVSSSSKYTLNIDEKVAKMWIDNDRLLKPTLSM